MRRYNSATLLLSLLGMSSSTFAFVTPWTSTVSSKGLYVPRLPLILVAPMSTLPEDNEEEEDSSSEADLLQAKLSVLEDVVSHLNASQRQEQIEKQRLQSQLVDLESDLEKQQKQFASFNQSHDKELAQQQATWEDQQKALKQQNQQELQQLERKLMAQAQVQQDEFSQQLRKETSDWKQQREAEWNESLEIATAAVTAAETREQALQQKVEHLEVRYHQEAAEYKAELDQLQTAWKTENTRLEEEVDKLQTELVDAKQKRDQETTFLLEELGSRNQKLEQELQTLRDQIKFQKLRYATQLHVAKEEWEEQRQKQRKFYTEAIRLLNQEKAIREMEDQQGFWRRIFRFARGSRHRRSGSKQNGSARYQ